MEYMNQYHIINLDITSFISSAKRQQQPMCDIPEKIVQAIYHDLITMDPELQEKKNFSLTDSLIQFVEKTGKNIIFIIDEWDALIREAKEDQTAQEAYLNLLREWFKNNNFTPRAVAAAYMTGILPIKKDGSQSAISDFIEFPILYPDRFAEYTGFTENEVKALCGKYGMSFEEVKTWYDGYDFPGAGSIYNPYSVMSAVRNKKIRSYWQKTSAAESLTTYIKMDFDGLQETIVRLISGEELEVDTDNFENDFETFQNRDDVLTLLIHLGYLAYHEESGTVRVPNEEIRIEFRKLIQKRNMNPRWMELIRRSQILMEDTITGHADKVACAIEKIRDTEYAPTFYNNEQSLRYVIKFAYIAATDYYIKIEELPSGHGLADVAYIPKSRSKYPAMIIEIKWNKTAEGALSQIKEKKYPAVLQGYNGEIVLVGINYDEKSKRHSCLIEKVRILE